MPKPTPTIQKEVFSLRLLWRYPREVLDQYPIPLEFRDEETGCTWANLSVDRFEGEYQLVAKGSLGEQFQHEFLVGVEQRRFELERLRRFLWKDVKLDVPSVVDIHDRLRLNLDDNCPTEDVSLDLIVPTQAFVYRWGVHQKRKELQIWQSRRESKWLAPEPGVGLRFAEDPKVYLFDGHHRYVAAREEGLTSMAVTIHQKPMTLDAFLADEWTDDTDYDFLADVLEEAQAILAEGKVIA